MVAQFRIQYALHTAVESGQQTHSQYPPDVDENSRADQVRGPVVVYAAWLGEGGSYATTPRGLLFDDGAKKYPRERNYQHLCLLPCALLS